MFSLSRKKGGAIDPKSAGKEAEIIEIVQNNPGIDDLNLVEKCFGPQNHGNVLGFGGGVTAKELRGSSKETNVEVAARLQRSEEEKSALEEKNAALEAEKLASAVEKEALQNRIVNVEANFMVQINSLRELVLLQQAASRVPLATQNQPI